jgi:hypothetical protein
METIDYSALIQSQADTVKAMLLNALPGVMMLFSMAMSLSWFTQLFRRCSNAETPTQHRAKSYRKQGENDAAQLHAQAEDAQLTKARKELDDYLRINAK